MTKEMNDTSVEVNESGDDSFTKDALSSISSDIFGEKELQDDDNSGEKVNSSDAKDDSQVEEDEVEEKQVEKSEEDEVTIKPNDFPVSWKKDLQNDWGSIPKHVQDEILRRENDFHTGIEGYKSAAKIGDMFHDVAKDYYQDVQKRGINPMQMVKEFFEVEKTFTHGSNDDKVRMLQEFAQHYGIVLDGNGNYSFEHDSVKALQDEVKLLKGHFEQQNQSTRQSQEQQAMKEIEQFRSDPKNGYFDELSNDIAALLRSDAKLNLKSAYDKAIWLNDSVREKELARRENEKAELRKAELLKAKKASSTNVKSSSQEVRQGKIKGDWQDNLKSTYRDIMARESQ